MTDVTEGSKNLTPLQVSVQVTAALAAHSGNVNKIRK